MNTFKSPKDYMNADLIGFINLNEFAEKCNIDGKIINAVIDNDRLQERSKKEYEGINVGDILYYVSEVDLMHKPIVGAIQKFNSKSYEVFDVRRDAGLLEIIIKRNSIR